MPNPHTFTGDPNNVYKIKQKDSKLFATKIHDKYTCLHNKEKK